VLTLSKSHKLLKVAIATITITKAWVERLIELVEMIPKDEVSVKGWGYINHLRGYINSLDTQLKDSP